MQEALYLSHRTDQQDLSSCKKPNDSNVYISIMNSMEKVLDFVQDGGRR